MKGRSIVADTSGYVAAIIDTKASKDVGIAEASVCALNPTAQIIVEIIPYHNAGLLGKSILIPPE